MKIISFSLWGTNVGYYLGAIKNVELAYKIYPNWICRFYCANNADKKFLDDIMYMDKTELVIMNEPDTWFGMFWRFFAADSDDVVISRDTDSRLSEREREAVDEWLNSKYDFHIMKDHPMHTVPILGGMWGARNGILKGIKSSILEYKNTNQYIDGYHNDQNFLSEQIYSKVVDNAKIHDTFGLNLPFPSKRRGREFIGQSIDENENEADRMHGDMIISSGM